MVTKTTKYKTGNSQDIDEGLDIPDFDFDSFEAGFDKKLKPKGPVMEVTGAFASGIGASFVAPGIIESTIRRALPPEYGSALDLGQMSLGSARSLYNQAVRELKPAIGQLKQATRQILPKTEGILSKEIQEKIKDWSKDESQPGLSEERMRDQALAIELGQIFQSQAKDADRREEAKRREDQIQDGVEQLRHRDAMGRLTEIAESASRIANFNDSITTTVYKKSLEVQLRQFYAVSDLLRETKIANVQKRAQLEAVVRNTGIVAKEADKRDQGSFKNKFFDATKRSMFGAARDFGKQYIGNIQKDLSGKITQGAAGAEGMAGALNMLATFASMDAGEGSTKSTVANYLGSLLGDHLVGKIQDKGKEYLDKSEGVNKYAQKIGYGIENMGPLLRDKLTDPNNPLGLPEGIRDYLLSTMPKTGVDAKIDVASLAKATEPAQFTNATQKSIVEVIPGLLARIQRELVIQRTGKDAPLLMYDYKSNKFSTEKKIGESIRDSFVGKNNQQELKTRFGDLFNRIDPNNELTDEQREKVKQEFLDRNIQGKSTDAKYLATRRTWGADEEGTAIAKFFQKYLRTNSVGEREDSLEAVKAQRELSAEIARLTRFFDDPRANLQVMAQLGQLDALQSSGLYDRKKSEIDFTKVNQGLLGAAPQPGKSDGDEMHEFDINDVVRRSQMPSLMEDAGVTKINRRREVQRDSRLVAQERQRQLRKALRPQQRAAQAPIAQSQEAIAPVESPVGASALASTVEAKVDTAALEKLMNDQIAEIKKIDPNANLLTIIEVMNRIDKRLDDGINTYSLTEDLLGPDARDRFRQRFGKVGAKIAGAAGTVKDKVKGLKDITLGDLFSKGASAASWAGRLGMNAISQAGRLGTTAVKSGAKLASLGLNLGGKLAQKGADMFGDVYVPGETQPRLLYVKMKLGKYFDKDSGKVLTSLRDIKGPVVDENGLELLAADELETSYVKGSKIRALKEVVGTAVDWSTKIGSAAVKGLGTFYGTLVNVAIKGGKAALKMLPPYDVYIKGQEKPVLTAGGFKTGEYFSEKTGKALAHPREIDGPVLNKTGDHLITEDDIRTGLVDKNGLTVTNKVARLVGKVTQLAKFGFKALKGIAGGVLGTAKEFLVGIGQAMKDILGGVFGLRGEYLETSKSQLEVQRQILKILMDRMPERKNVKDDTDGDGIRDGSAEDIRRKEAAAADKASAAAKDSTAVQGQPGGGKGLLSSIAGMLGGRKKKGDGDEDGEGDTTVIGGLGGAGGKAAGEAAKDAGKIAKSTKWLGKGGRLARAAGGLWGATKWAGRAGLALAGLSGLGLGGLATGALSVGGSVLGAVGSGLAAAGTAVAGLISAPVILTALGVAAVATAGYYGYKYLTRKKLETLSKVRFAQYGFSEQDKDRLEKVFGLEDKLIKNVKFDGDKAYIDSQKVDTQDLMEAFEVKMNSNFAPQWLNWFSKRFKPVFLGHVAALKGVNPEVQLGDVDSKLKPEEKLKYLDASAMPGGPYDFMDTPFPDMKSLSVGESGVKAAVEIARADIQKEVTGSKTATAAKAVGAAATGAAALATTKSKDSTNVATGNVAPTGANQGPSQALKDAVGAGAAGAETVKDASLNISGRNSVPADYLFTGQKGIIDALSSVRFKAYGLVEMDMSKVKDLAFLETQVAKGVTFDKDGAMYDEDIRDLLARVKIKFGIVGPESPEGREWINWFRCRFLPVFLNYRTVMKKATGKEDYVKAEMLLTPSQQLDAANAMVTTTAIDRGRKVSIWDVTYSPWRDYTVNTDSSSTDLNIQFLTEAVKAVKAGEQKSAAKKKEEADNEKAAISEGKAVDPVGKTKLPIIGDVKYPKTPEQMAKERQDMAAKNGYIQPAPLSADGKGVRAIGDFVKGEPIKQPGKGTGGDINALPEPTGPNWAGMRAMFEAAAKMTGVDVKTLAAMCAIESNFNPDAKAGTSSASGLFQFLTGTWNGMLSKYGAKYGIDPRTPATDPRAAVLMGAEFIKENLATLKSQVKGRELTNTDAYMAHFLGPAAAAKFLNADPNAIGADVMRGPPGKDPVASNPNVFFDKNTRQARTIGEIYKLFNMKMDRESKRAGLGDAATPAPAPKAGPTPGDSAGGGNVAAPQAKPADKPAAATATAALAAANSTPAPVSAVATNVKPAPAAQVAQAAAQTTPPATDASGGAYAAPSMVAAQAAPRPPVRPVPDFSGFSPQARPTGAEINAQADAARKALADGVLGIGKTLSESLDVQRKMLDGINTLVKNGGVTATPVLDKVAAATKPAANAPSAPTPQRAPAAPVSMGRNY